VEWAVFYELLATFGQTARKRRLRAPFPPTSPNSGKLIPYLDPIMKILTCLDAAREREEAAALSSHYRQIGSKAIIAAVLALTRQRELLASASQTAKKAA
jgi:hypothetical protein